MEGYRLKVRIFAIKSYSEQHFSDNVGTQRTIAERLPIQLERTIRGFSVSDF